MGALWNANGETLATGGAFEGIGYTAPCFYQVSTSPTRVEAGQTYVAGFWVRGGQYSYVPNGFDEEHSNAPTGHLVAGTGLYAYTVGGGTPFPTDSWENADYLVSPAFTPDPH